MTTDQLALAMVNAERERHHLPPLPLSALIDKEYDKVKRYARTAVEDLHSGEPEMNQMKNRYWVEMFTDGPAVRWNIIDRQGQVGWRFASEAEAVAYANKLNAGPQTTGPAPSPDSQSELP